MAQAGEKYWGAVTALLNAIGKALGMSHYRHRDCQFIKNGNPGILIFKMAEEGHMLTPQLWTRRCLKSIERTSSRLLKS